ncbi:MAG: DUF1517 domain-containing protein [Leptolyngbyaceae cyanobacterium CRU_2_3]|nr:DUF1517 domain-containing protein [Leptolyngbyaceae cyanobacterium CRU_2_3]
MKLAKLRLLGTTALTIICVNHWGLSWQPQTDGQRWSALGDRAAARSSGGRSRGGSFSRPSGGSRSSGSAPRSNPAPNPDPYYPSSRSVPVPIPGGYGGYGYGFGSGFGFGSILLVLLLGGGVILPIMWIYFMRSAGSRLDKGNGYAANKELDNDIVTVTQLQIALLAQARDIQNSLTELTANADTESQMGLSQLLQESVLALLRAPENWTHVRAMAQVVKSREAASQLFEKISIEERSKFSTETLSNVGGRVRHQALPTNEDDAPASYIVVTLIVGTADDRLLFDEKIYDSQALKSALQRLGSIPADYLMVFELLWSPQDAADSLTYDELLTEYPGLVQI